MSNENASLRLNHVLVDLDNRKNIYDTLYDMIAVDNDLVENEMYFRKDTLELGFNNEADRVVKDKLKTLGYPTTIKTFEKIATKVFEVISNQDYFGECSVNIIKISENKLSLAYAHGGIYY